MSESLIIDYLEKHLGFTMEFPNVQFSQILFSLILYGLQLHLANHNLKVISYANDLTITP